MRLSGRALIWSVAVTLVVAIPVGLIRAGVFDSREVDSKDQCMSNVRQLGLALIMYATDSDDKLPPHKQWMDLTEVYRFGSTEEAKLSSERCPLVTGLGQYGYALNAGLKGLADDSRAATTPMVYDSSNLARNASDMFTSLPNPGRHDGVDKVGYADGHVKNLKVPAGNSR